MSGYVDCACRDCFEIAIAGDDEDLKPFCHACEEAGCADAHAGTGECLVEPELEEEEAS